MPPYAHIVTNSRRIPVPRRHHLQAAKLACDHLSRAGPAVIQLWPLGTQIYKGRPDRRHYEDLPLQKPP